MCYGVEFEFDFFEFKKFVYGIFFKFNKFEFNEFEFLLLLMMCRLGLIVLSQSYLVYSLGSVSTPLLLFVDCNKY